MSSSIAKELADWLIHNNVVEHIFGPNLHIEVSKCKNSTTEHNLLQYKKMEKVVKWVNLTKYVNKPIVAIHV